MYQQPHNQNMKRIRQPVPLFVYTKTKPEPLTTYSRRINIQHRLVYQIIGEENAIKILRLWSHYE